MHGLVDSTRPSSQHLKRYGIAAGYVSSREGTDQATSPSLKIGEACMQVQQACGDGTATSCFIGRPGAKLRRAKPHERCRMETFDQAGWIAYAGSGTPSLEETRAVHALA